MLVELESLYDFIETVESDRHEVILDSDDLLCQQHKLSIPLGLKLFETFVDDIDYKQQKWLVIGRYLADVSGKIVNPIFILDLF